MRVLSDSSTLRLASSMAWPSAEHTSSGYSRFTSRTELLCRLSLRTSMVRTKYCTWNLSYQHSGSVPRSAMECLPIIRIIGRPSGIRSGDRWTTDRLVSVTAASNRAARFSRVSSTPSLGQRLRRERWLINRSLSGSGETSEHRTQSERKKFSRSCFCRSESRSNFLITALAWDELRPFPPLCS